MESEGDLHKGSSPESFGGAANAAVKDYEMRHGPPDEPILFKVEEMHVVATHNPIHEYRVTLRRTNDRP